MESYFMMIVDVLYYLTMCSFYPFYDYLGDLIRCVNP